MSPKPAMQEIHTQSLFHWAMPPRSAQACMISALPGHALKACNTCNPYTYDLCSTGPHSPGLHRPAQYPLPKPAPLRPAKLGSTNTQFLLHQPCPQVCTGLHDLCSAGSCLPGQACRGLWAMPPRPAKPGATDIHDLHPPYPQPCTGLHNLRRDRAPKACQASNPQTCRISTPLACALQAYQVHAPKSR
jgi:hypothetical protein